MLFLRFILKAKTSSMFKPGKIIFLIAFISLIFNQLSTAQTSKDKENQQVLEEGIHILRKYFYDDRSWQPQKSEMQDDITGLIHFIEDSPIDTVLLNLDRAAQNDSVFVFRLPENVEDSLDVPGYLADPEVEKQIQKIQEELLQQVQQNPIPVPEEVIERARNTVQTIPEGQGMILVKDSKVTFPAELEIPEVIPDSVLQSPEQFQRLVKIDSLRNEFLEEKRKEYNAALTMEAIEKATYDYRARMFDEQLRFRVNRYRNSVKASNYEVLRDYNNIVMAQVNDTIRTVLEGLGKYAQYIDSTKITFTNLDGVKSDIILHEGQDTYARIWLKNEQNDSLLVLVKSTDKRGMQMLINDGVTFSRFSERQTKNFDFEKLKLDNKKFSNPGKFYEVNTPWKLTGDGSLGFTQTYYENWKKGGESSVSILMILKGAMNYASSDAKVIWNNSAEIRTGYMRPGSKDEEPKKTDDKFELTTRFGVKAVDKWYYSSELTFNTQFFKGYTYPKSENPTPISGFMAPAKTIFKIGMNYTPNKNLSLLFSPFSLKNVYVRDTSVIDQTNFGVDEGRKAFWEVGLNADLSYKKQITSDLYYETKYKMFINYKDPFKKLDIDWENNVRIQLTTFLDMKMMLHLLYDDNVLFPVYDDAGTQIGEKAKLQIEEFITIGFSYTINKNVMKAHRLR